MSKIHWFSESLLTQEVLNNIDQTKVVTGRPNGWHYDLDIAWILESFRIENIKPGSLILDAGAGLGICQFLLARAGYHIVSLDFSERTMPKSFHRLFNVSGDGRSFESREYTHQYMQVIDYGEGSSFNPKKKIQQLSDWLLEELPASCKISLAHRAVNARMTRLLAIFNRVVETWKSSNYSTGSIHMIRAPFHDCQLAPESFDAIISISAIEHSDVSLISDSIKTFQILKKPSAKIFLTTSISTTGNRTYDHTVAGLNFGSQDLALFYGVPNAQLPSKIELEEYEKSLINLEKLWLRLDDYYRLDPRSSFYKKNFHRLPYLPIGLEIL